ncbi:MAG TPA: 3,4-dehydroadipyl-CoA semialdehyde dehydrogenase [Vicinamibacteria bacterium]|nr:3,4-dehydroadipyl-CoA semialdehyde dehydrogenase [Vicinamibacteria bacterium]
MTKLKSYLCGEWREGEGEGEALLNPATEEILGHATADGLDRKRALDFARTEGGPALRALTFKQRAELVQKTAALLQKNRDELIGLAMSNGGNTRSDAKFDVDGAIATLQAYAETGTALGDRKILVDGEAIQLGRAPRLVGQHVLTTRHGVAVHVNAFNFPAWGLAEKAAVALLAGMPVLTKPATSSALVAHRLFELLVEARIWPAGALSLLMGRAGDLVDHLEGQDCLAFTGGASTAALLRNTPGVVARGTRINVEADSLNAAVLGPDVEADSETYDFFLKDVLRDMTQKAGQKCTAIRRILVPEALSERFRDDLADRLAAVVVGNPVTEGVRMGPVATASQKTAVLEGMSLLARDGRLVHSRPGLKPEGVSEGKGFFVSPTLLEVEPGAEAPSVHSHEVFGPVATIVPYDGSAAQAVELISRGAGGLVSSVYSEDVPFVAEATLGLAPFHGRLFLGSAKIAELSPGPGTVLPQLVHGGPGRAGNGEELGGERGLAFYMQRTAIEGSRPVIDRILKQGGA